MREKNTMENRLSWIIVYFVGIIIILLSLTLIKVTNENNELKKELKTNNDFSYCMEKLISCELRDMEQPIYNKTEHIIDTSKLLFWNNTNGGCPVLNE